jgi:hypothetical protein
MAAITNEAVPPILAPAVTPAADGSIPQPATAGGAAIGVAAAAPAAVNGNQGQALAAGGVAPQPATAGGAATGVAAIAPVAANGNQGQALAAGAAAPIDPVQQAALLATLSRSVFQIVQAMQNVNNNQGVLTQRIEASELLAADNDNPGQLKALKLKLQSLLDKRMLAKQEAFIKNISTDSNYCNLASSKNAIVSGLRSKLHSEHVHGLLEKVIGLLSKDLPNLNESDAMVHLRKAMKFLTVLSQKAEFSEHLARQTDRLFTPSSAASKVRSGLIKQAEDLYDNKSDEWDVFFPAFKIWLATEVAEALKCLRQGEQVSALASAKRGSSFGKGPAAKTQRKNNGHGNGNGGKGNSNGGKDNRSKHNQGGGNRKVKIAQERVNLGDEQVDFDDE